jgi:hypothetical protein
MCKDQGKKADRPNTDTGESVGICQYTYQHGGGIAYLYDNQSKKYTLDEEVEFTMQGLEIEGKPGQTSVAFKVPPG